MSLSYLNQSQCDDDIIGENYKRKVGWGESGGNAPHSTSYGTKILMEILLIR